MGVFWSAFLDGFTMSGLSTKLSIPGVPERIFAEPAGADRWFQEEILGVGKLQFHESGVNAWEAEAKEREAQASELERNAQILRSQAERLNALVGDVRKLPVVDQFDFESRYASRQDKHI
jgi:hypothetical protein